MEIENSITIIAPSSLHLPLYEQIYARRGNCLHINVLSLQAWLQQLTEGERKSLISVLYEYADRLQTLSAENVFYPSRRDYDFLKSCLDFIPWLKMYAVSLDDFVPRTEREKSLLEVLERLLPVPLWQQEAAAAPLQDLSDILILDTEFSAMDQFWIDRMQLQNAKIESGSGCRQVRYWSAANERKMMEVCADAIIEQKLDAQSVMVALGDPSLKRVFCQVFDARRIPYTFLHEEPHTRIIGQWKAMLTWIKDKDRPALENLLRTLWPAASADLLRCWKLMPGQENLLEMEYEENPLISRDDFLELRALQQSASDWKRTLERLEGLSLDSLEEAAAIIQQANPSPDEEDLRAFDGVIGSWNDLTGRIQSPEDLDLFIRHLDTMHPSRALPSMEGVIVGTRQDISCLREHVFYLGADAKTFPGSPVRTGIFDEAFVSRLPLPALEERLQLTADNAFKALSLPENLTIIVPQADYEGKSIEPSHDIAAHYGMQPVFCRSPESSVSIRPGFDLRPEEARSMLVQEGRILKTHLRALDTYEACPLRNLLRYGLHLRAPYSMEQALQVSDRRLFEMVLARAQAELNTPFYDLSESQIAHLVHECFAFGRRAFPKEEHRLARLEQKCTAKLVQSARNLRPLGQWNVQMISADGYVNLCEQTEGMEVYVQGTLNRTSNRKASLSLVDLQAAMPDNGTGFFETAHMKGTLNFDLQPAARNYVPYHLSYGRGKTPVQAVEAVRQEEETAASKDFFRRNMVAQNLGEQDSEIGRYVSEKVPTYEAKNEKALESARSYAKSVSESRFLPEHTPDACIHCSYRSICRNAAVDRGNRPINQVPSGAEACQTSPSPEMIAGPIFGQPARAGKGEQK